MKEWELGSWVLGFAPSLASLCAWADHCLSLSRILIPEKERTVSPPGGNRVDGIFESRWSVKLQRKCKYKLLQYRKNPVS